LVSPARINMPTHRDDQPGENGCLLKAYIGLKSKGVPMKSACLPYRLKAATVLIALVAVAATASPTLAPATPTTKPSLFINTDAAKCRSGPGPDFRLRVLQVFEQSGRFVKHQRGKYLSSKFETRNKPETRNPNQTLTPDRDSPIPSCRCVVVLNPLLQFALCNLIFAF